MGIIQIIITKHKEKVAQRNDMCDSLIAQIDNALKEIDVLFLDLHSFVEPTKENEWRNRNTSLIESVNITNIQKREGFPIGSPLFFCILLSCCRQLAGQCQVSNRSCEEQ